MAIAKNVPKKAIKNASWKRAWTVTYEQFTSTSTIHGLKHVNDPRGTRATRSFWTLVPLICFLCAITLMITFLMRYKSNPTRINVDTNFGPISDIDFPAVIFCNPNFITDSRVENLIKTLEDNENFNRSDLARRIKYTAGFTNNIREFIAEDINLMQAVLNENRYTVEATMKRLMYPCEKLLYRCRWQGQIVDCKEVFSATETYQGYCCGFNIRKPKALVKEKRKKVLSSHFFGPDMGLSVVLNPLIEKGAMTSVNSEGMKIIVTEPKLYPGRRSIERMVPHLQETFVEVRPERTDCSSEVRQLPISDRGCVFSNEYALE